MSMSRPTLLLVSDDALFTRSVLVAANAHSNVIVATSVQQALTMVRSARAVVLDGALIKTQVRNNVIKLRTLAPLAPLLYVAPQLDAALINELQAERVQLTVRPLPANTISLFLERAFSAGVLPRQAVSMWIQRFAVENRLTRGDVALLPLVLGDEESEDVCERLGYDRAQLTRALRRLVKKCRVRNTDRLARNLMRDAYLFRSDLTAELIEAPQAASF
jgi:hypothetical protein